MKFVRNREKYSRNNLEVSSEYTRVNNLYTCGVREEVQAVRDLFNNQPSKFGRYGLLSLMQVDCHQEKRPRCSPKHHVL